MTAQEARWRMEDGMDDLLRLVDRMPISQEARESAQAALAQAWFLVDRGLALAEGGRR